MIAGYYLDGSEAYHGFLRAADGTIASFDPTVSMYTAATGINDKGRWSVMSRSSDKFHGFARTADGTVTSFDAPEGSGGTFADSIDAKGAITGYYAVFGGGYHGFERGPIGTIKTFDPLNSNYTTGNHCRALWPRGLFLGHKRPLSWIPLRGK